MAQPRQTPVTNPLYVGYRPTNPWGFPLFQIVCCTLNEKGEVLARHRLEPLYELWEDANEMAAFDASRLPGDYGYDAKLNSWWGSDLRGQVYRIDIEPIAASHLSA